MVKMKYTNYLQNKTPHLISNKIITLKVELKN